MNQTVGDSHPVDLSMISSSSPVYLFGVAVKNNATQQKYHRATLAKSNSHNHVSDKVHDNYCNCCINCLNMITPQQTYSLASWEQYHYYDKLSASFKRLMQQESIYFQHVFPNPKTRVITMIKILKLFAYIPSEFIDKDTGNTVISADAPVEAFDKLYKANENKTLFRSVDICHDCLYEIQESSK